MGWSPEAFWRCDVLEWVLAVKSYTKMQQTRYKEEYDRARWMVAFITAPHTKRRIRRVQDVARFPWDAQISERVRPMNAKDWKNMERLDKFISKVNERVRVNIS